MDILIWTVIAVYVIGVVINFYRHEDKEIGNRFFVAVFWPFEFLAVCIQLTD